MESKKCLASACDTGSFCLHGFYYSFSQKTYLQCTKPQRTNTYLAESCNVDRDYPTTLQHSSADVRFCFWAIQFFLAFCQ